MANGWGSTVNDYGRLGLWFTESTTATTYTVKVNIWFGSKYSVSDTNNTLYFDVNSTSATTDRGSVSIKTTVASGSGWSSSNEVLIKTYTYTYQRGTSAKTINCAAKLTGIDRVGGTMYCTQSFTVPALASYKVTYNANGGSGAPSAQTKYYGQTLKLSTTKPTRNGWTFVGWGESANDTTPINQPGGNYTGNAAYTYYAIWKKTITLSYNANGGSGAPNAQSVTIYNSTTSANFGIPSTKPTRTGYNFKGWGLTSSTTTVTYNVSTAITLNNNRTVYAVWELKTYTIKYNANGGTGAPSNQTKSHGVNLTLSNVIPTKSGHKFLGWAIGSSTASVSYSPGSTCSKNENITLYAIWERLGIANINVDGTWKEGKCWINVDGTWKTGFIWINDNGEWKQGGA